MILGVLQKLSRENGQVMGAFVHKRDIGLMRNSYSQLTGDVEMTSPLHGRGSDIIQRLTSQGQDKITLSC